MLIFEAESDEEDTILQRPPLGFGKWKVTLLESLEGRTSRDHQFIEQLEQSLQREEAFGPVTDRAARIFLHGKPVVIRAASSGASRRLGDVKIPKARLQDHQSQRLCEWPLARSTHCATSTQYPRPCSTRETTDRFTTHHKRQIWRATAKASMFGGEMVNLIVEKIASDRNPSVTMMNLVEELLAPDDVPAYLGSC